MYTLSTIAFAFGLTLAAGLSTAIGGAIAVSRRNPGPAFMAVSLGFSAGVMLYVSFVYLMPEGARILSGEPAGGEVTGRGTGVAVLFLATGVAGLQLLGAQDYAQQLFYGGARVAAVTLSRYLRRT